MIVAPSAACRKRQHRASDGIDLLVDVVHDETDFEALINILHAKRQEARREDQSRRSPEEGSGAEQAREICWREENESGRGPESGSESPSK